MNEDLNKLVNEFNKISHKGWIASISNSFGSIGLTFEKELGKESDCLYFPDYYGIEIKCTSVKSKYPLYLFTLAFDGPTFPEINRIIEKYGYSDKDYPEFKVLATKVSYKYKTIVNKKFKFQLEFDKKEEKLYLAVYNLNNVLIEKKSFVYIDSIKQHLLLKLKQLAIIYAKTMNMNNKKYFSYYKLSIYKLISFERFIELIEKDIVEVSLIARISKSGNDIKRYRNKNLVFQIKKDKIDKLFTKIYEINYDDK